MTLVRLFLICHCCMIRHRDDHNRIWKKRYGFYLNKKSLSSHPLRPGWNYAVVLCNDFMGNSFSLFWVMCNSVKGPCDIISLKIWTAYDVCFSRYRPSNSMLATDCALVLVFINFLWVVYLSCRVSIVKVLEKFDHGITVRSVVCWFITQSQHAIVSYYPSISNLVLIPHSYVIIQGDQLNLCLCLISMAT